jgi:hypothetical protein
MLSSSNKVTGSDLEANKMPSRKRLSKIAKENDKIANFYR